ncbi:MAG TPA: M48 family metallopeptidase [Candidatus Doudnabacteria bacterium]|nr:M48 family metallopeptidase [Candidatus Doudnabacteria bacterium]
MLTYTEINKNKTYSVLLIFVFLLVIIGLGFVFAQAYGAPEILFFAVIFSSISAFISYFYSDKITLSMSGAKQIDLKSNPELYQIVENLSITAGLPMPRVYIMHDTALNAFATGRNPEHAVVAVTTGLLEKLNRTELEGVLAHELSHIGNYDIRFMTLVVVLVGIITLLADWMLRMSFFGGRRSNNNGGAIFLIIGIALAILSPIIAMLIKLAVSRRREFLADASGALLTRYPEGLASALEKIAADHQPLERANKATAHLFISNPLKDHKGDSQSWFAGLFNTHPPIEERIKRLRGMDK